MNVMKTVVSVPKVVRKPTMQSNVTIVCNGFMQNVFTCQKKNSKLLVPIEDGD